MITFNRIPTQLRVSVTLAEVDNSGARGGQAIYRTCLVGQKTSAGSATANTLVGVSSAAHAAELFGSGSMLHRMFLGAFKNDPSGTFVALPMDDNGSGVAATGLLTITGPATETGTLHLWIAGEYVPVTVTDGDTAIEVAAAIEAAVDAVTTLPVTATQQSPSNDHKVTITAKNDGTLGNGIDIRLNYLPGQTTPAGLGVTITAMSSGATDVTLATGLDALGDEPIDFLVVPYTDSTSLGAIEDALSDVGGRWDPVRGLYGQAFTFHAAANLGSSATLGAALNDPGLTAWSVTGSPTWAPEAAAACACAASGALKRAPAAAHGGIRVRGVAAPASAYRYTLTERNTLLYTGIATLRFEGEGVGRCYLDTTITTYQDDSAGNADESYLHVQTRRLITLIQRDAESSLSSAFAEHSLVADATPIPPGLKAASPAKVKGHLATRHDRWLRAGWCQGETGDFVDRLVVEINADSPTRLDVQMGPVVAQPLNTIAVQNRFLLTTEA